MSSSNCCFLTCIQISQEAGQVVWYSHLFQNFPEFVVIHTVKGFSVANLAFLTIQQILVISTLVPLPFLNPAWTSRSSLFMYCWSLAWRILSITLLACGMSAIVQWFEHSLAMLFLGCEWKLPFSSPMATAESSKFAGILSAALSRHHLLGFEIIQLEFHHLHYLCSY